MNLEEYEQVVDIILMAFWFACMLVAICGVFFLMVLLAGGVP